MAHQRVSDILVLAGLGIALGAGFGGASRALAAERPVAVSPGSASKVALIGDGCPTFSWGAAEGAKRHELVVYRLVEEGEEAEPVLQQTFAGSASSWTPALDRCLERGGQYAWSVRAVSGDKASEWSAPSLFEVAPRTSEAELEEALAVVKSYIESGASGVTFAGEVGGAEVQAGPTARVSAPPSQAETSAGSATRPSAPQPLALSNVQLTVDGAVMATAFGGDGSNLTNVTAEKLPFRVVPVWVDYISGTAPTLGAICGALDQVLPLANGFRPIAVDCNNTQEPGQWLVNNGVSLSACGAGFECIAKPPPDTNNLAAVVFADFCDALGSAMDGIVYCLTGPPPPKKVFVTSTTYSGNLGGLSGADAKCNARAAAAGLPGPFKAWLSDSTCSPAQPCRSFTQSVSPYVRLDGIRVAADWVDLTNGFLLAPINRDESGQPASGVGQVWTGTGANGTAFGPHCGDWKLDENSDNGAAGASNNTNSSWAFGFIRPCDVALRLYCFEQ